MFGFFETKTRVTNKAPHYFLIHNMANRQLALE
jgi:hypothetical protein